MKQFNPPIYDRQFIRLTVHSENLIMKSRNLMEEMEFRSKVLRMLDKQSQILIRQSNELIANLEQERLNIS